MCFAEERTFPMKPEVNWKQVEVVAFDLFGTVFKLDIPKEEIQAYAEHIAKPEWSPLVLPEEWGRLEMFEDAKQGLMAIEKNEGITCITLSNAPYEIQEELDCDAWFDYIVLLEDYKVFKPNVNAYSVACIVTETLPRNILMVTANEYFGDLEKSRQIGMQSILIDRKNKYPDMPHTILELAQMMEEGRR